MEEKNPFELGKNRIEALADGFFAIAMTFLIIGFKVPDLPADTPNVELAPALARLWPTLLTYTLTFSTLGVYWIQHHMIYHAVKTVDRVLLALSILFFLYISILPFSVQLLEHFHRAQITAVIFGANIAIVGWLLFFQWRYVLSKPRMIGDHITQSYKDSVGLRILIAPIAATLTTIICFWSLPTSVTIYILLLVLYFVYSRRKKDTSRPLNIRRLYIAAALLVALVGWYLFRPELLFINQRVHEAPVAAGSKAVASGQFKGLAHETTGTATIYQLNNDYTLRFTNFSTSNGPDVHIYLVAAPDASSDETIHHAGFINLGKLKGNKGEQNYTLPTGIDLDKYRSVCLWCQRFEVNFGAASLK